jgi:hypothetical protein
MINQINEECKKKERQRKTTITTTRKRKTYILYVITHLPSSSLISYSSVKRVVVTIVFDIGILFVTAAILLIDVVIGGDTFILLSLVLFVLL